MYYKVVRDDHVVDVLNNILYVKYQPKHEQMLLCDLRDAEAILSSDGNYGFHIEGLFNFYLDNYKYQITEINKFEYEKLKKALEDANTTLTTGVTDES